MTRRDVVLLVLILLLGGFLTLNRKVREGVPPIEISFEGLQALEGPVHTFTETREVEFRPGGLLRVEADRGEVEVLTWDQPRVRVEASKRVRAASEEQGAEIAGARPLQIETSAEATRVRLGDPPAGKDGGSLRSRFTVHVPRQSRVTVQTTRGEVQVHGVRGDVAIRTSHAEVKAGDLGGACEVENRHGPVTLSGVRGSVTIRSEHHDIRVSDADREVTVDLAHGDATVTDAVGPVTIRSRHGAVTLRRIRGNVNVDAPHSSVTLAEIGGDLDAAVVADPLEAEGIAGSARVQAEATSVEVTDVRGVLRVTGSHTDVRVVRPGGNVEIQTTHQGIDLTPPAGAGFRLEARSDRGDVVSSFPGLATPGDAGERFSGVTGDGSRRYVLATSYGTIQIHPPR
jgi:hypothetical protein